MVSVQLGRRSGTEDGGFRLCGLRHGMDDGCVSRELATGFQPISEALVRVHKFTGSNQSVQATPGVPAGQLLRSGSGVPDLYR